MADGKCTLTLGRREVLQAITAMFAAGLSYTLAPTEEAKAAGVVLTPTAIAKALAQIGISEGAIVPLGGANWKLRDVRVEQSTTGKGEFAVVFKADPA